MSLPGDQSEAGLARHNERELLLHYRPWLRTVAASLTTPDRAEDLAQEAWIALWRAANSYDGRSPLDFWLKRKARNRMLMVLRDWETEQRHGQRVAKIHALPAGNPSAELTEDDTASVWTRLRVCPDDLELAYHHGEIADSLSALTPREREYVVVRFWGGMQKPELIKHFGYEPTGLWRTAKKKLSGRLVHLQVVAA